MIRVSRGGGKRVTACGEEQKESKKKREKWRACSRRRDDGLFDCLRRCGWKRKRNKKDENKGDARRARGNGKWTGRGKDN